MKTPVLESLLIKLQALKETQTQMFSCEYCEIFKNTLLYRTPPVAASELKISLPQRTPSEVLQ